MIEEKQDIKNKTNEGIKVEKKSKIQFSHLFLFSGQNLEMGQYQIRHPKLKDILDLPNKVRCEDLYWQMVSLLLSDPYENMVMLDDMGLDYEDMTAFDVFVLNWKKQEKLYEDNQITFQEHGVHPLDSIKNALSFFLGERNWQLVDLLDEGHLLYDLDDMNYLINADLFEVIVEFIKTINCFDYKDRVNPKNKTFKRILIEDMRDEQERRLHDQLDKTKDDPINMIGSMVSGICVGGNGGINIFNVNELSIYQIHHYFTIEQKKNKVDKLLTGIYAGTVMTDKINESEFKWTV